MSYRKLLYRGVYASMTLFASQTPAQEPAQPQPLPEPLTLEYALSLADSNHPQLRHAQAVLDAAQADLAAARARNDITSDVEARTRWIQPPDVLAGQGNQDHRLRLSVRKRLFDFGRTGNYTRAARSEIEAGQWRLIDAHNQRRLEIMQRYFDVLLADLAFARENEAMAVGYIQFDRTKDRRELGQRSDIEVMEAGSAYQETRRRRFEAEAHQRATRARLALALNRPSELSAKLALPKLPDIKTKLPEVEALQEVALKNNPSVVAMRAELQAARQRLAAARAEKRPYVDAEVAAGAYSRDLGSNEPWGGGVTFTLPIFQGGRVAAAVAQRQAEVSRMEADLDDLQRQVREEVLETWLELDNLRIQHQEIQAVADYRELYLDRARVLYDQEVRTDLGDAMVEYTDVTLRKAKIDYSILLGRARLDALTGKIDGDNQP